MVFTSENGGIGIDYWNVLQDTGAGLRLEAPIMRNEVVNPIANLGFCSLITIGAWKGPAWLLFARRVQGG